MERGAGERQAQGVQERGDASMNLGIGKRSLLGLVAGAIMTLGVAAPAFASNGAIPQSDTGTVNVSGTNNSAITLSISNGNISFNTIDPSTVTCAPSQGGPTFTIKSNRTWTGSVAAADTVVSSVDQNTSLIPRNQLYWSHATANCGSGSGDVQFGSDGSSAQWASGGHTSGLTTDGGQFTDTYSLSLNFSNNPGNVAFTLTYTVTQGTI
jgi:hypothetical protein